jgi:uncharacterized membrane protein
MKPAEFLQKLDDDRVAQAIADAEGVTSGEIRVFVTERDLGKDDVLTRATARFEKLGMTKTRERNAVLLYFAPLAQKYAIIGDRGIHEQCGQPFWDEVAAEMGRLLKNEQFTEAVVGAVKKVGDVLARHFPRRADDQNELPNKVERERNEPD